MNNFFRISLREDSRGGNLADEFALVGLASKEREKIVLLVHGFNKSAPEAIKDLRPFALACRELAPTLDGNIGFVVWPGDSRHWHSRLFVFPWKIRTAVAAGKLFAEYLQRLVIYDRKLAVEKLTEVVIVAHSLGCRLVLEALDELARTEGKGRRISTILMAAAVPVRFVDIGPFDKARECFPNMIVLHSKDDRILKVSFPLGSRIGEPFYDVPEAIGLNGHPRTDAFQAQVPMFDFGHTSYWKDDVAIPELVSKVCGHPRGRTRPDRTIAGSNRAVPEWEIPERSVDDRSEREDLNS